MNTIRRVFARAGGLVLAASVLGAAPAAAQALGPLDLYLIPSCRLFDTRGPVGPTGGPAMGANSNRCFQAHNLCGIPNTATAVELNLTAVGATDFGNVRAYPGGGTVPPTSVLNFRADGGALANRVIVPIGQDGTICFRVDMPVGSTGQVHLIGNVFAYFLLRSSGAN